MQQKMYLIERNGEYSLEKSFVMTNTVQLSLQRIKQSKIHKNQSFFFDAR